MLRRIPPRPASAFLLFYGNKKHSQNGTGKKLKFPAFYQYRSGWFYFSLSGSNTAEAGNPGIPLRINMGIRVRLCSDWCLREADGESDYPQTAVSCIVRTQYPYFAQRYAGITGFGPLLLLLLNWYFFSCTYGRRHMRTVRWRSRPWRFRAARPGDVCLRCTWSPAFHRRG